MASQSETPEGVFSLLDTDLYKLTMQSAVLKHFSDVGVHAVREELREQEANAALEVTYGFTNRTAEMKLSRAAYKWLRNQIDRRIVSYLYLCLLIT